MENRQQISSVGNNSIGEIGGKIAPVDLTTLGGDVPLPPPSHEIYRYLEPREIDVPSETYDPQRIFNLEQLVTRLHATVQQCQQQIAMMLQKLERKNGDGK